MRFQIVWTRLKAELVGQFIGVSMISSIMKIISVGLVLAGIILAGTASAATNKDYRSVASRFDSVAQREAAASIAVRTLRYITQARSAIHDNNINKALQNLQWARELLELIKAATPTSQIKGHIWVANEHMKYETAEETIEDLVLIDFELANLEGVIPAAVVRRHLMKAREALEASDKKTARQEMERMLDSLIVTEIDLPLAATEQQIQMAKELLIQNKPDAADEKLKTAEESVQFLSMGGNSPLARAWSHLRQALKEYANEYYAAAKAELAQASQWLRQASKRADTKGKYEAQDLAAKVDALREKLGVKADDYTHTLSGFIHRSVALIEREAEELWLRYKRQQTINTTLRKLMDAKLHFKYAEHELKEGDNIKSIRKELEKTEGYLEEAQNMAEPKIRKRIKYIRQEVRSLENDLGSDQGNDTPRYDRIMADLRALIQTL